MQVGIGSYFVMLRIITVSIHNYVLGVGLGLGHQGDMYYLFCGQPRKPGSLPTPGAATKTLVQAGHVTLSKIFCLVGWGKYQITCFHIQAIHFKCKERDVVVAKNNMNFLI